MTKRAALLCTVSTSDILDLEDGSHTVGAYSSCDRTKDFKHVALRKKNAASVSEVIDLLSWSTEGYILEIIFVSYASCWCVLCCGVCSL